MLTIDNRASRETAHTCGFDLKMYNTDRRNLLLLLSLFLCTFDIAFGYTVELLYARAYDSVSFFFFIDWNDLTITEEFFFFCVPLIRIVNVVSVARQFSVAYYCHDYYWHLQRYFCWYGLWPPERKSKCRDNDQLLVDKQQRNARVHSSNDVIFLFFI